MKITPKIFAVISGFSILFLVGYSNDIPVKKNTSPYPFDLPDGLPPRFEPADNPTTIEGVTLGKKLFYDTRLSGGNAISCANCHHEDKAFCDGQPHSLGNEAQTVGLNAMPLFNLAWIENYFWNGRAKSLEEAVLFPITDHREMAQNPTELIQELNEIPEYAGLFEQAFGVRSVEMDFVKKALAQYLRSLTSFGTPLDKQYPKISKMISSGISQRNVLKEMYGFSDKTLITLELCEQCHGGVTYGGNLYKNNGIASDGQLLKAPSFRNLIFTSPYMHDGRFKTLEEVLEYYNSGMSYSKNLDPLLQDGQSHALQLELGEREKKEMLYFLKELMTDSTFIKSKY